MSFGYTLGFVMDITELGRISYRGKISDMYEMH